MKKTCPCGAKALLLRPKDKTLLCRPCFLTIFEQEVHQTIIKQALFKRDQIIAVGASGGKDSTVLVHILNKLNKEKDYGIKIELISVDQGIAGYRDDSLQCVKLNHVQQGLPLTIVSYKQMFGWTMDQVVKQIGKNRNCTYCGVFRRQALEKGALMVKADKIATGHNADDMAQTVLLNVLRGDYKRLAICSKAITGGQQEDNQIFSVARVKPFKLSFQKQIVLYAHHKGLRYFSTECTYSPNAFRGHPRQFIKQLEAIDPMLIINLIHSAEHIRCHAKEKMSVKQKCERCGMMTSVKQCKACKLLLGLSQQKAKIKIE